MASADMESTQFFHKSGPESSPTLSPERGEGGWKNFSVNGFPINCMFLQTKSIREDS